MVMFCALLEEIFPSCEINDCLSVCYKSESHASLTLKYVHSRRGKFTLSRHLTGQESAISHPASRRTSLFVAILTQIPTGILVTLDNNSRTLRRQTLRQCLENTSRFRPSVSFPNPLTAVTFFGV
jgi:hypothetical protein